MCKSNSSIVFFNNEIIDVNSNAKYLASGDQCSMSKLGSASMSNFKNQKQIRKSQCIEINETNKLNRYHTRNRIKRLSQNEIPKYYEKSMRDFTPKESKSSLCESRGINDFLRERKSKLK